MDLSDLINRLSNVSITNLDTDLINKIIICLFESSEEGKNNYTHYFDTSTNITLIIEKLITYFPDMYIQYTPNTNYIFIDWS